MRGSLAMVAFTAAILGCSEDLGDPFAPVPECMGVTVAPFMGSRTMVVSALTIADVTEGFDLDRNGKVDNKLGVLGAVANSQIAASFETKHDIVLPIEMYGYNGEANRACAKFSFYLGLFNQDRDKDGRDTTWEVRDDGRARGDCLDTDGAVKGDAEVAGNRLDEDCDGYADNDGRNRPTDTQDLDGDGVSPMQGDCDDRGDAANKAMAASRKPGAKDICDDGIDQNCDGVPDNDASCDPFAQNNMAMQVQSISLDQSGAPLIQFKSGKITNKVLEAGPDVFKLSVPFEANNEIELELRGARVKMTLVDDGSKTNVTGALMGGVLQANSLSQITGIDAGGVIKPEQSLLDAIFVGAVTPLIGLDSDKEGHYLPDIDVDHDGLESFWQETLTPGGIPMVDTCRDGDGTIIKSTPTLHCAMTKDAKGNFRFVDGLSIALKFDAVPAKLGAVITK